MLYVPHFQTYLNRGENIHRKENHIKYLQSSKICSQGHFQLNWLGATTRKLVAARFLLACKDSSALGQGNVSFQLTPEGTGYGPGFPDHTDSLGVTSSQRECTETETATAWWQHWALDLKLSHLPHSTFCRSDLKNRFSLAVHSAAGLSQQGQDTAKFAISQQPAPPWIPGPAVFWQRGSDPAWKDPQQTLGLEGSSPGNHWWNRSWFSFHVSSLVLFLQSKSEV